MGAFDKVPNISSERGPRSVEEKRVRGEILATGRLTGTQEKKRDFQPVVEHGAEKN